MSRPMNSLEFWEWFASNAAQLALCPEDENLIKGLDDRIHSTWPQLSWEIGPDVGGGWQLTLSPNLNPSLQQMAANAVSEAPVVPGWKFYAHRQRKQWDGQFEMESKGQTIRLDTTKWRFALIRHPNQETEIKLYSPETHSLEPDDRWHAAAIALEGILGERRMLEKVKHFSVEFQHALTPQTGTMPIEYLNQSLDATGSTPTFAGNNTSRPSN